MDDSAHAGMAKRLEAFLEGEDHAVDTKIIEDLAQEAFARTEPSLWTCFENEGRAVDPRQRVHGLAMSLLQWKLERPAWLLEQLHHDQTFKQSIREGRGRNLGHTLFGITQVARTIGHRAAERHYGALATIGDVLFQPPDFRGQAPFAFANLSDWSDLLRLMDVAFEHLAKLKDRRVPIYPEALLAAQWFPSKAEYILDLATARPGGIPFVDLLLSEAERTAKDEGPGAESDSTTRSGTLFEAAAALLLSSTPGFESRSAREDVSSQTDVLLAYLRDPFCRALFPDGYVLVECKHWKKPVGASFVREFGARCLLRDVKLGILVTKDKITGAKHSDHALKDAERERRDFLAKGTHILVLSGDDLRLRSRELRGLEVPLKEDFEHLRFGRRA